MNKSAIAYRIDSLLKREHLNENDIREMFESEISSSDMDTHIRNRLVGISDLWSDDAFSRIEDELNLVFRLGVKPTEKWLRACLISMREKPVDTCASVTKHSGNDIKKARATRLALLMLEHMQDVQFESGEKEMTVLMDGIATNNPDIVQQLINLGVDVNEHSIGGEFCNSSMAGCSPLILAALTGNAQIVEMLLKAGADANDTWEHKIQIIHRVDVMTDSRISHTALSSAASVGNADVVDILLRANPSSEQLSTALICAVFCGYDEVVKRLLKAGASIQFDSSNQVHLECLYGAVHQGYQNGVDYLISAGLLFNNDKLNNNALFYACYRDTPEMLKKLSNYGCELTKDALKTVAKYGGSACFQYLLDILPAPSADELNELLRNSATGSGKCLSDILRLGADPHIGKYAWDSEGESLVKTACKSYNLANDSLSLLIKAALQIQSLRVDELEDIYSSLIHEGMLDELKLVYNTCGNAQALQASVEDHNILNVVEKGQVAIMRFLLDNGIKLSPVYTLRESVERQDIECVKLALEARGDMPVPHKALCDAIESGFNEAVRLMLAHGVSELNVRDDCENPLCRAILSKNASCIEMLLKAGADVNTINRLDDKDLIVARAAVRVNDVATLTRLMEAGLQIHEDNDSLLKSAVSAGAEDCLKFLLPLIKTSRTELLCKCASLGRPDIISLLLEAGADIKTKREVISGPFHTEKRPPLLACMTGNESINKDKERESVEILLKAGGKVNDRVENPYQNIDKYRCCLGEAIIRYCSADSIALLLAAGAEVNTPTNKLEETPLMLAAATGQARVVELLLKAGADVNIISAKGATALMLAADSGFPQIVRRLIEAGADMQAKDYAEKDAFMYALKNGNLRSVEELLIAGCKPSVLSSIPAPFFPMVDNVLEILRRNNVAEEDIARLLGSMLPSVVSESKPDVENITKLVNYGAAVNAVDENGNTGLLSALLKKCSGSIIKAMMAAGADPRVTNSKGQSCVEIATKAGCAGSVITMLEKAIAKIEKAEAKAAEKAAKVKEKEAKAAKKKK